MHLIRRLWRERIAPSEMLLFLCALLVPYSLSLTTRSSLGVESQVGRQLVFDIESKMTCMFETLEPGMIMKLGLAPYPGPSRFPLQMRLTSPSGEFSEWAQGDGEADMKHNVTEEGDYEICLFAPRPVRILLNIFFHHPEKVEKSFQLYLAANQMNTDIQKLFSTLFQNLYKMKYAIKFYNQITVRDEATQEMNSEYIKGYATVFSAVAILLALVQVTLVRRMFRVDVSRIRI